MIAAITNTATNTIMFIRIIFKANDPSSLDCLSFHDYLPDVYT